MTYLKSNMDRFIVSKEVYPFHTIFDLKSNMDRFIDLLFWELVILFII